MLDQFLATLRDSDLVVPVFLFFLLPSMRKQELSSGERWPRANSYVPSTGWLVKKIIFSKTPLTGLFDVYSWGKASAARKMTAKKKNWMTRLKANQRKKRERRKPLTISIYSTNEINSQKYIVTFTSYSSDNAVKSIHVPPDLIWEATRMNLFLFKSFLLLRAIAHHCTLCVRVFIARSRYICSSFTSIQMLSV
jgi:hypothetical protein